MSLRPLTAATGKPALQPRPPDPAHGLRDRWHWQYLLSAPHRLAFFAGSATLAMSALWWSVLLIMRTQSVAIPWAIAPPVAHALVMTLAFFPFFFVGFSFTAGPKWLQVQGPTARQLLPFIALQGIGWLLCIAGLHVNAQWAGISMLLIGVGWAGLTAQFIQLWHRSTVPDKVHSTLISITCVIGTLVIGALAIALFTTDIVLLRSLTHLALWWWIALVFVTVSHRMIPFFSASAVPVLDAWRPMWLLGVLVGIVLCEGVFAYADLTLWPFPPALRWAQVAIELPAALLLLWLVIRWGLLLSLRIRLLAMLHTGFVWLGIAVALQAISHGMQALGADASGLGLAPLHALTMGYLGSTLFAMATRVNCGHNGKPLVADNITWGLYGLLQLAIVLRIASILWPPLYTIGLLSAVLTWTIAWSTWFVRQ